MAKKRKSTEPTWDDFARMIAQRAPTKENTKTCVTVSGTMTYDCGTNADGTTMWCTDDYSVTKCTEGFRPPRWFLLGN